jgi:NitT/TauT family transport system permease protein
VKLFALLQCIILAVLWVVMPNDVLPSPVEVFTTWNNLALQDGLLIELGHSAVTIAQALLYSSIISAVVAYGASLAVIRPIASGIATLRFLGFAGITFIFTMLTTDGGELKVWLLTFGMTVFLLTNMLSVTMSITQAEVDYAKTLRMSKFRTVYELLVRGKLADFLDMVRQNAAIGWTMLSMVEGLVRSEGGIGSLLLNQNKHLHLAGIFAIQLTILLYGLFQDYMLGLLRQAVCPHIKYINVKG